MTLRRLTLCLATLGLAVGTAASSYNVTLDSPTWAGETKLNAGDYRVQIVGDKAVFKSGKNVIEVPTTVETNASKYALTSAEIADSKIKEIDLGGTNTKITFPVASAGGSSGNK
jgi:hypothetical protein